MCVCVPWLQGFFKDTWIPSASPRFGVPGWSFLGDCSRDLCLLPGEEVPGFNKLMLGYGDNPLHAGFRLLGFGLGWFRGRVRDPQFRAIFLSRGGGSWGFRAHPWSCLALPSSRRSGMWKPAIVPRLFARGGNACCSWRVGESSVFGL